MLANLIELSDQSLQRQPTLECQHFSRLPIQCRTVLLNVVVIDPNMLHFRS
jgi:hypothetical protein